jgi:hypothetical protein
LNQVIFSSAEQAETLLRRLRLFRLHSATRRLTAMVPVRCCASLNSFQNGKKLPIFKRSENAQVRGEAASFY